MTDTAPTVPASKMVEHTHTQTLMDLRDGLIHKIGLPDTAVWVKDCPAPTNGLDRAFGVLRRPTYGFEHLNTSTGKFVSGTIELIETDNGPFIRTAKHLSDGLNLMEFMEDEGLLSLLPDAKDPKCYHAYRGVSQSLTADVHFIGDQSVIVAWLLQQPSLREEPMNATLYSYGFPAGVSRTRSDAPVFRSFAYHGEAQSGKTDRVWYVSSGLAPVPGGMSGSGGYSLVDNKPESVLVGTALFDLNRLAALPPNYAHMALFERIHKDMILRLVSEAS